MPTLFQQHVTKWSNCSACELCRHREKVVLARGKIPAEVLVIGEAPGESEDSVGIPFIGPAGRLLDQELAEAITDAGLGHYGLRIAFSNLVACIPKEEDGSGKLAQPPKPAIKACSRRLKEFVDMVKPRLVVLAGALAQTHAHLSVDMASRHTLIVDIIHPAAILRANVAQKGLMIRRTVIRLRDALEETFNRAANQSRPGQEGASLIEDDDIPF